MNFRRLRTGLVLGAFFAAATAGVGFAQTGTTGAAGVNPNAPPPPPVPGATGAGSTPVPGVGAPQAITVPATAPTAGPTLAPNAVQSAIVPAGNVPTPVPIATPSPLQRGHRSRGEGPRPTPSPDASDTPEPPQFSTLDGIWEIEIQPIGHRLANYQHFSIVQNGSTLTGYWEHDAKKIKTPITGNFDGRLIQIVATEPAGNVTFSGYVESFGDMVGLMRMTPADPGIAFTAQHRKKEKS